MRSFQVTGQSKLIYGGYSLGCTLFFASMAQDPQLNDGIEVMFGLGPTGTIVNLNNSFRFIAPLDTPLQVLDSFVRLLSWTSLA